jgi:hypothetical protein
VVKESVGPVAIDTGFRMQAAAKKTPGSLPGVTLFVVSVVPPPPMPAVCEPPSIEALAAPV